MPGYNNNDNNDPHLLKIEVLILSVGEDVDKREPSYTVDRNVNWCSHCGKQYGGFLKKWQV